MDNNYELIKIIPLIKFKTISGFSFPKETLKLGLELIFDYFFKKK